MRMNREQEFIRKYNRAYSKAVGAERKKRRLSLEKLSSGIMSGTMLDKVERGVTQWTKMEGDTLMLRMGIPAEYFESLASGEDLERWRQREDICLLVPGQPEEAAAAIDDYRQKYIKGSRWKNKEIIILCREASGCEKENAATMQDSI